MLAIQHKHVLRPGEKIRNFESQNYVHCFVSVCSSMIKLLHGKSTNVQNLILIWLQSFFQSEGIVFTIKFNRD